MASIVDDDYITPITDRLRTVHQQTGYNRFDVFRDWIVFILSAIARDDETYLERVRRYESEYGVETMQTLVDTHAAAFGHLVDAMDEAEPSDVAPEAPVEVLGAVYEHYGMASDAFGQHFTPQNVCHAKAALIAPSEDDLRSATPDDPLTISDPACGSGRLLLAAAYRIRQLNPEIPLIVVGQDIDPVCARMTAVNLALCGIPGYAIQGDSLTMEVTTGWRIRHPAALVSGDVESLITECASDELPSPSSMADQPAAAHDDDLFDANSEGDD